jgi:hypothetical protein
VLTRHVGVDAQAAGEQARNGLHPVANSGSRGLPGFGRSKAPLRSRDRMASMIASGKRAGSSPPPFTSESRPGASAHHAIVTRSW